VAAFHQCGAFQSGWKSGKPQNPGSGRFECNGDCATGSMLKRINRHLPFGVCKKALGEQLKAE
jgi:hypothetical protein